MKYERFFSMINRATRQHLAQQLKPYQLNESNFMLVLRVCEVPGISQDQLNREIYREHSIVTKAVNRLAEKGWIRIETDPDDHRRTSLLPTEHARQTYPQIKQILNETEGWLADPLTSTEQQQLEELLEKMAHQLIPKSTK